MRGLSAFSCCGWAYSFTFTSLSTQTLPQIWECCLKSYLMQVCKPCHYVLIETVEPFKLHQMSMAYLYEVLECLLRFWMGIWLHIHNVTIADDSSYLWELGEILPDTSVQTMPLRFDWSCRTFQTSSHVHVIPIWGVWAPSQDVLDGPMTSHSHCYHHRYFPRLWDIGEILPDASVQTMPSCFDWAFDTFQTAFHVHGIHIWVVPATSQVVDGYIVHIHISTNKVTSPDLWELDEILPDASVQTMPLRFGWGCGTFQTASHVHAIPLWEVSAPSHVVDGHMASHLHHYQHRHFPRFGNVA